MPSTLIKELLIIHFIHNYLFIKLYIFHYFEKMSFINKFMNC